MQKVSEIFEGTKCNNNYRIRSEITIVLILLIDLAYKNNLAMPLVMYVTPPYRCVIYARYND